MLLGSKGSNMIAYASRTGTATNLRAQHAAGWRQLVAPGQRPTHCRGWMVDNGAWSAHLNGGTFDGEAFLRHLGAWGRHADHVVVPDIVAGGLASLDLSLRWLTICHFNCRRSLIAVQDGMVPSDLDDVPLGHRTGIFVGGTTDWKLGTLRAWGQLARNRGCWLHVGRVNSIQRIRLCEDAGADSFDGTGPSRFAEVVHRLEPAIRQQTMFGALAVPAGL